MTRRSGLCLAALLVLGGCDAGSGPAPAAPPVGGVTVGSGWGLATPEQIGDFTRVHIDPPEHPEPGITAGYSHLQDDEPVIATISVHPRAESDTLLPAIDIGTGGGGVNGDDSGKSLAASIGQVRRFYPKATVVTQGDAFMVQRGALQSGRQAVLEYQELHEGQRRAMRLHIYSFCCLGGSWAYEYRFRYPATVDDETAISVFLRESSWTVTPPS